MDHQDSIQCIMEQLNPWDIIRFSLCSSLHVKAYLVHYSVNKRKYFNVILTIPQYFIKELLTYPEYEHVEIRVHHGFGIKILIAACCNQNAFIQVPVKRLNEYVSEFKSLGLYHSNPTKSKILVYDTHYNKHIDYINNIPTYQYGLKNYIILTTYKYIEKGNLNRLPLKYRLISHLSPKDLLKKKYLPCGVHITSCNNETYLGSKIITIKKEASYLLRPGLFKY